MEARCRSEITELHRFFQDWFNGELPSTDAAFGRFTCVMAPGFALISPDGRITDREALIVRLREAHGSWNGGAIRVDKIRLQHRLGELAVLTYEEWQNRGRLSSAVLARADGTPNGLAWLHVHEVWLPPAA